MKKSTVAESDLEIEEIEVFGARVHNLKDIDVRIPRNKLVVITGISGSGKSSLAFDTIYAEGQRRYMESFSAYARQFVGAFERPDVDKITGLSPVISIEQKTTSKNPRSTVGTVTEIYDFLRLLFARVGEAYSYNTNKRMVSFSDQQIMDYLRSNHKDGKIVILAPVVRGRKGHYRELFEQIKKQGYLKVRVDGEIVDITKGMQLDRYKIHDVEIVIDRLVVNDKLKARLVQSVQTALNAGGGLMMIQEHGKKKVNTFSKNLVCEKTGISYDIPSPNTFSFNSPYGACPTCKGLGFEYDVDVELIIPDDSKSILEEGLVPLGKKRDNYSWKKVEAVAKKEKINLKKALNKLSDKQRDILLWGSEGAVSIPVDYGSQKWYQMEWEGIGNMIRRAYQDTGSDSLRRWAEEFMYKKTCHECSGQRLRLESRHFKLGGINIAEVAKLDIGELNKWLVGLPKKLNAKQKTISKELLKEIRARVGFLLDVGLDYLALDRPARSLSGGESQRIRLATQIGSQLVGITYILDEPSIGLHQRDNHRLIESLKQLAEVGNTVIVVEHDRDIMLAADHLIDLGPGAGALGGEIVGAELPGKFEKLDTITAKFLDWRDCIPLPENRREGNGKSLILKGAEGNNLKKVTITIPLAKFICVTGVSGSGKSTLINETLYPILRQHFYGARKRPLKYKSIKGLEHLDKVIEIDQSPIGRTPRSNPATYIGLFTDIRTLFAKLPEAQIRGYKPGRFSFNVKGGRCETCEGGGMRVIEMNFLPNVNVECEGCQGRRYNRETLEVRYKGKSISDVLAMSVKEAVPFFEAIPKIYRKLKTLQEVGLGYITLGQSATTLSGGEAQRVKLSSELSKRDTGKTMYILDEPTTGLHFQDIKMLLTVLNRLADKGNTVLVIEH
ncbi:excinuclease ABC subunit UvrA, partial [Chitinophagales bacterium]|nr:excinuclease ABC subunit UvrA [Chitinophagales bacterium]